MEGFNYVVNPPVIPRVVFGSSLERVTLPLSGPCLSSFMRQHQGDVFLSPGPTARIDERDYLQLRITAVSFTKYSSAALEYLLEQRNFKRAISVRECLVHATGCKQHSVAWPSKIGYSSLISKTARLPPTPNANLGIYDLIPHKPFPKAYKPFNIGAPLKDKQKFFTPSPASYPHHLDRPQYKITTAFGSQRKIHPFVTVICTPFNMAQCCKCEQTPIGDYWHNFDTDLDLCRSCMHNMERELRSCTATEIQRLRLRREFANYKHVRYCDFYHDHGGTKAAVQFLPKRILKMKTKKENYLSLYM